MVTILNIKYLLFLMLIGTITMINAETPTESILKNELVMNEAALAAYSRSKMLPVAIKHCMEIDKSLANEISELFSDYTKIEKDRILHGEKLATLGTSTLSADEINKKITDAVEQVESHFNNPKKRNVKSCMGYKAMLEFELMFLK